MKIEGEPNWLLKYREEEEKAANELKLEDRNIFLKYVEKENEFYFSDLKEKNEEINELFDYDKETFKDKFIFISRLNSTANSIGSSSTNSEMKPRTIIFIASNSDKPLDSR